MTGPAAAIDDATPLRRDLRLVDAVAIGLGAIIGAGIFVVTGVAARIAGPSFLVGLLLAGLAAACNALSSAQFAAAYPQSGGTYEYGYRVLNPSLGFAAGWLFLLSKLAAGGTVALGFGAAVAALWPAASPRAAGVTAAVLLTVANYFGIKKAGRLNTAVVSVSVTVLVAFVIAGVPAFDAANLAPFAPGGMRGVLESAALLFFAYTGYARVATLGEEVHDPRLTIPRAIGSQWRRPSSCTLAWVSLPSAPRRWEQRPRHFRRRPAPFRWPSCRRWWAPARGRPCSASSSARSSASTG
jgi:basic amino acid/polyamine antiporter, APA family